IWHWSSRLLRQTRLEYLGSNLLPPPKQQLIYYYYYYYYYYYDHYYYYYYYYCFGRHMVSSEVRV
ncbi:hypothetical protein ACMBCM_09730, partial [Spiroplasma sp. K1]